MPIGSDLILQQNIPGFAILAFMNKIIIIIAGLVLKQGAIDSNAP